MKSVEPYFGRCLVVWLVSLLAACDQGRVQPTASLPEESRNEGAFRASQLREGAGQSLMISEFMAVNGSTLEDQNGEYSDWIELFNYGSEPVELLGWGLTDDPHEPTKWPFPEGILNAGERLLVFASGKGSYSEHEWHCSFKLSSDGEFLGLSNPSGQFVHQFLPNYGRQYRDLSYGVAPAWKSGRRLSEFEGALLESTPGGVNSGLLSGRVEPVEFSLEPGVHRERVLLGLMTRTREAKIWYTLDGSDPIAGGGMLYEQPLALEFDTVIRAYAVKERFLSSPVATGTYLVSLEMPEGAATSVEERGLPIISIVPMSEASGFGRRDGAGEDAEQEVSLEWIDLYGGVSWRVECGLRGLSDEGDEVGDRFRLRFRDRYGLPQLKKQLFGAGSAWRTERLELRLVSSLAERNSSQALRHLEAAFWEYLSQDLMGALGQAHLRGRFCRLYFRGMESGVFYLSEVPGLGFANEYFDGKKSDFDILVGGSGVARDGEGAWYRLEHGSEKAWGELLGQLGRTPFDEDEIAASLDVDSFVSFVILNWFRSVPSKPSMGRWTAIRNRSKNEGFRFLVGADLQDRFLNELEGGNPRVENGLLGVWDLLITKPGFRLRVHDVSQILFFDGGPLSPRRLAERGRMLLEQVVPHLDGEEKAALDVLRSSLETRRLDLLKYLRSKSLVSKIGGVEWEIGSDEALVSVRIERQGNEGEIVYTIDGSDPRLQGGQMSPSALAYGGAISVRSPTVITCRVKLGSDWGPICRRPFDVP